MSQDPYSVLGVPRDATADQIKSAYRKLARQHHPDVNPDNPESEEKFKEVSAAYAVLSDPEKRARFDQFGETEDAGGTGYGDFFGGSAGFADIFGMMEEAFGMGGRRGRNTGSDGDDHRVEVTITLNEVLTGVDKTVKYKRMATCETCSGSGAEPGTSPETCPTCNGSGSVTRLQQTILGSIRTTTTCGNCQGSGKIIKTPCHTCQGRGLEVVSATLSVTIPAGIENGTAMRIGGKGSDGTGGGRTGDLYVVVAVANDSRFERHGRDLVTRFKMTYSQAVLGDHVEVEGLNGTAPFNIDPGTQPGAHIKIKGEGLPRLHGGSKGDLIVVCDLVVPKKVSDPQAELLKKLAESMDEPVPKGIDHAGFLGGIFGKKKK